MGVQIREMRVPSVVESGKKNHVILDCDYDISSESEGQQVDVKWFFRNEKLVGAACLGLPKVVCKCVLYPYA